jgi:hypothetical protein
VGKPVDINIEYQNSGREPASGLNWLIEPILAEPGDDTSGAVGIKIQNYLKACREKTDWQGGGVVYPTTASGFGGGGYTLNIKSKDDFVDDAVAKGEKLVIVQGCFVYRTADIPRHSYFCYFYRQGFSKIQNLHICASGHYAD